MLTYCTNIKTGKGLFNPKETVFLLLLEVEGYFAKASDKELQPPFLTHHRYHVLGKFISHSPFITRCFYIFTSL